MTRGFAGHRNRLEEAFHWRITDLEVLSSALVRFANFGYRPAYILDHDGAPHSSIMAGKEVASSGA